MFFSFGLIARLEIVTFNFDNDYLVTEKPNVNVLFFLFHFFSFFLFFFHISSHSEVKSINFIFYKFLYFNARVFDFALDFSTKRLYKN